MIRTRSLVGLALAGLLALALQRALAFLHAPAVEPDATLPIRVVGPLTASPRLQWRPVSGAAPSQVSDFAFSGSSLFLFDRQYSRLTRLDSSSAAWNVSATFPTSEAATSLISTPLGVGLLESDGRITWLDNEGRAPRTEQLRLPCPLRDPVAIRAPSLWLIAGDCPDSHSGDTVVARLDQSADGITWQPIDRVPRYTRDLQWGHALATLRPLSISGDSALFGLGLDPCVRVVSLRTATVGRWCGLSDVRFSAPAPSPRSTRHASSPLLDDTASTPRPSPTPGAMHWPDALPVYLAIVTGHAGAFLVRLASNDSVIVHQASRPFSERDVQLVAPAVLLVGCAQHRCLWYDAAHSRLSIFDADRPYSPPNDTTRGP